MATTTAAGTSFAISAGAPASQAASAYQALTFTEVNNVESIGAFGASYAKVEFQPLKGAKQKHKGSADYGSLQLNIAVDDADAGQTLLRASADSNAQYAYRVTYPDNSIRYFQGRTFGFPESVSGADSVVTAAVPVEINTAIVKVAAA